MIIAKRMVGVLLATAAAIPAVAEDRTAPIKIGVLTDMTGAYSNAVGPGSVIAAQMAINDFGGEVRGLPIELLSADMLNKVDVSTSIAREWVQSDGVDVIVDVPISSGSLAVNDIVAENDAILFSAAGSTELSGAACNGHTVQWIWDNYAMASALTKALVAEGDDKWFYITVDYTFGHDLERMSQAIVETEGGEVVGAVRQPWGTVDQSSAVFEVASSDAKVVGLANGGTDTVNSIKQLKEFGVGPESGKKIAAFVMGQADIKAVGLDQTEGLYVPMSFYWDLNDDTRAFSKRFMEQSNGVPPTYQQAGVYSEITHYLKALAEAPTTGGADVLKRMREMEIDDSLFGKGELRVDGRRTHPMYLLQVKSPEESIGEWDFLKVASEIPADQVVQPLAETGCDLVETN
ncbi:MAG: ABC transporter substrate-binding protein [Rhodobacteraceae bacterium]|nr:ABC transporter substrate-binding protein [Paracoccaceae bacterium]MBR9823928.1 ABC transporter substrate-binding protein [Paracoccaceae bacterium]